MCEEYMNDASRAKAISEHDNVHCNLLEELKAMGGIQDPLNNISMITLEIKVVKWGPIWTHPH